MSVEDLKKYGKLCVEDPAVKAKAKEIGLDNIEGQVEYAKSLGFNFTGEDLVELSKEVSPQGELSDEDLEAVAGGFVTTTAAAVVGAAAGVVSAGAAVTSTTSGHGW